MIGFSSVASSVDDASAAGVRALRFRFAATVLSGSTLLAALGSQVVRSAEADEPLTEVVVTGSRLSANASTVASPVVVIDSEELRHQGTAQAEQLLNSLPQVNSGLTPGANGASVAPITGTATVDLRGIGAFRTLVLVNGRRTAPGDPINPSADLNTIPTALISRVEVLTGGASAIYGSDAVAGVVNFILNTDFTGLKADVQDGVNRASNSRTDLQNIALASGVTPASGSSYDGRTVDASIVWGTGFQDNKAHLQAYATYHHQQEITGSRRDYSACTLIEAGNSFQCLLDNSTANGQFISSSGAALTLDTANGHAFRPITSADFYNPAAFQDLQRPDTRYNVGFFAGYQLNDHAQFYGEAQYMRDTTTVHYEPTATDVPNPTFTGSLPSTSYTINCADPQLSATEVAALCPGGPVGTALVPIGRRNVEGGARSDEFRHDSYRVVLGVKGEIGGPWSYDADFVYGRVNEREAPANDFSTTRLANALNVVNVGGAATCQSVVDGSDPSCVPYNIWQAGGVTAAALNYVTSGANQSGHAQRIIVTGQVVGDLQSYGLVSPLAHRGVAVAAGAEYRDETVQYTVDPAYSDLLVTSGVNGAAHANGSFHVSEVFAEVKAPLVQEKPFAEEVVLNLSDRYARYNPQGNVNAFGVGLEWAPVSAARLRGSFSRAVRAPNAYELFRPQVLNQTATPDPCAGPLPLAYTQAQCAYTGVTAAQYGSIAPGNINVLLGGNPNLKPESADTYSYGLVLTPAKNAFLSVDYWHIKVSKYVGGVGLGYTLPTCLNTGDPVYCSLIQRDAAGSLSGAGANAGHVVSTLQNTGSYGTSGVDIEGRYALDFRSSQRLTFSFTGSVSIDNPIAVNPATPQFDCTGLYGVNCSGNGPTSPVPRWRHRLRTTWRTWHELELSVNWRHIGAMASEYTSSKSGVADPTFVYPVDSHIPAFDYFDFDASLDVTEKVNVRLGITNLTDKQPPVVGLIASPQLINGNMVAGMYDSLGRYVFLGLTAKF